MASITLIIFPAVVAAVITYVVTPLCIKLAWKFNIIDDPKKNKHEKVLHTKPIPRAGSIALYMGILISMMLFLPFDKHTVAIEAAITILVVMGVIDDKKNLSPYPRLIIQCIVALLPVAAGIGIAYIANPLTGGIIDLSHPQITFELLGKTRSIWIVADTVAFIWIIYLMNAVNFGAKGVDGQLSGVVAIAAIIIAILSLKFSADVTEWPGTILAAIVGGAFFGFLPWHIYPQKIMPGFGGSTMAAFLLAVLSILTTTKMGTLGLVLAVPIIDTGYVIVRRILSGKSPFWGDRGHFHHRLLDDAGFSKHQVALFYWGVTLLLGCVALIFNSQTKLYTILGVSVAILWAIIWLTKKRKKKT
jgi:UDP-GlcNAc:undecaprenyl-phosphate GlcNAc-1-phosphate transferase